MEDGEQRGAPYCLSSAASQNGWATDGCYVSTTDHDVRMGRIVGRLFVGGTLFLITFIGYSSQIFIIWPWYGRELSVELLTLLIPFK